MTGIDFIDALKQLQRERDIPSEVLIEAIEAALVSAYKKKHGTSREIKVEVDWETGNIKVRSRKKVVEEVEDSSREIPLKEAKEKNPDLNLGDFYEEELPTEDFSRIAAQTAKQIVVQRIREAEKSIIYDEFINKVGEILSGVVNRKEGNRIYIGLGKAEALLPPNEQVPSELYRLGERMKVYLVDVKKISKGSLILVSRTHPGLVKRLFELEVPEIQDGTVEIKGIAREPGVRTKIAVHSNNEKVDPVGACVGSRGVRVQAITDELRDEKIDIIRWSPDIEEFIRNALAPAKITSITANDEEKRALVVVPDDQLSLAIGKHGQNVRLAARLTNWKIDIRGQTEIEEAAKEEEVAEEKLPEESQGEIAEEKVPEKSQE